MTFVYRDQYGHIFFVNISLDLNTSAFAVYTATTASASSTPSPRHLLHAATLFFLCSHTTPLFSICCESHDQPNAETSSLDWCNEEGRERRYAIKKVGGFMEPITRLVVATSERCDSFQLPSDLPPLICCFRHLRSQSALTWTPASSVFFFKDHSVFTKKEGVSSTLLHQTKNPNYFPWREKAKSFCMRLCLKCSNSFMMVDSFLLAKMAKVLPRGKGISSHLCIIHNLTKGRYSIMWLSIR